VVRSSEGFGLISFMLPDLELAITRTKARSNRAITDTLSVGSDNDWAVLELR
jgi:hypothetical protein